MNRTTILLAVVLVVAYVVFVRGSNPFAQAVQGVPTGSPGGGVV